MYKYSFYNRNTNVLTVNSSSELISDLMSSTGPLVMRRANAGIRPSLSSGSYKIKAKLSNSYNILRNKTSNKQDKVFKIWVDNFHKLVSKSQIWKIMTSFNIIIIFLIDFQVLLDSCIIMKQKSVIAKKIEYYRWHIFISQGFTIHSCKGEECIKTLG